MMTKVTSGFCARPFFFFVFLLFVLGLDIAMSCLHFSLLGLVLDSLTEHCAVCQADTPFLLLLLRE